MEAFEAKLEVAADKLGEAMKAAPEAERAVLKELYDSCKAFVDKKPGQVDISALFAFCIINNGGINSEGVIGAAAEYINADLEFCRHRRAAK